MCKTQQSPGLILCPYFFSLVNPQSGPLADGPRLQHHIVDIRMKTGTRMQWVEGMCVLSLREGSQKLLQRTSCSFHCQNLVTWPLLAARGPVKYTLYFRCLHSQQNGEHILHSQLKPIVVSQE